MKIPYSEQQLHDAVKNNFSIRQVLKTLGLIEAGGNYTIIKDKIKKLNINCSHFTGKGYLKGKTHNWSKTIPLENILVEHSNYQSHKLKLRLIENGLVKNECSKCQISNWQGKILSLHLDHINGVKTDNRIENLRLLCPNCHSLTSTYCGRNKKKQPKLMKKETPRKEKPRCIDCGLTISKKSIRCKSCSTKFHSTKISWPSVKELKQRLNQSNYSRLAKELGVSGNAIRKHLRNHIS